MLCKSKYFAPKAPTSSTIRWLQGLERTPVNGAPPDTRGLPAPPVPSLQPSAGAQTMGSEVISSHASFNMQSLDIPPGASAVAPDLDHIQSLKELQCDVFSLIPLVKVPTAHMSLPLVAAAITDTFSFVLKAGSSWYR
jgi:hypothetical protein